MQEERRRRWLPEGLPKGGPLLAPLQGAGARQSSRAHYDRSGIVPVQWLMGWKQISHQQRGLVTRSSPQSGGSSGTIGLNSMFSREYTTSFSRNPPPSKGASTAAFPVIKLLGYLRTRSTRVIG